MSITRHRGFKHVLSGVALSALTAGSVAFAAAPAHADVLIEAPNFDNTTHVVGQWFIAGAGPWRMALDEPAHSLDNAALITNESNGKQNQRWHFSRQRDRSYQIHNVNSGKCITATPAGPVVQSYCTGRPEQHWTIKELSDRPHSNFTVNGYQFVNMSTHKALARFGEISAKSKTQPPAPTVNGVGVSQRKPKIDDDFQIWRIDK